MDLWDGARFGAGLLDEERHDPIASGGLWALGDLRYSGDGHEALARKEFHPVSLVQALGSDCVLGLLAGYLDRSSAREVRLEMVVDAVAGHGSVRVGIGA